MRCGVFAVQTRCREFADAFGVAPRPRRCTRSATESLIWRELLASTQLASLHEFSRGCLVAILAALIEDGFSAAWRRLAVRAWLRGS